MPVVLVGEVTGAFLAHEPMVTSAGPVGQGGGMRFAVCLAPPDSGGLPTGGDDFPVGQLP